MALKFLDGTGLSHFWEKLKSYFVKGNARVFYGTCATAAATAEKAVTCADFLSTDLTPGSIISVKFSITNSAAVANLTLNVNSTGAKGIRYIYNGSLSTLPGVGYIKADQLYHFTYDGTYWVVQMIYNTDSDWRVRNDYGRFKVGTGGVFPNTIVLQTPDGNWASVVTSSSAETSKTKNSSGFLPDVRYVRGSGTAIASGGVDSSWQFWQCNVIDARYSFNIANTDALRLVNGDSIYLVGTIGSDGLFYLADKWWSNALPSSDDGKCYIYIGNVYSWYQIGLSVTHPAYIYKNGALRLYGGYADSMPVATTSSPGAMSANDKAKLDGIADGAEQNVQANWNQTNTSADDYIKNKPGIVAAGTSTTAGGLMSQADKTKLNGIAAGAEVNVQSNWTQTTTTADDYIKNKPTVPDRLNVGVNQQGDATLGLKSGADGTVFGEVPISDIIDAANAGDFASVKTATGTSPTTISAWTWTTLCTLTLDPGTYFIYGYVHDGPPNVNTLVRLYTWENDVQVQRQASATGNVSFGSNDLVSGICRMTSTKTVSLLVDNSVAISNTSSPYKGELIAVRVVGNVDTGLPVRTVHSNTEALFSESYKFPDGRLVINIRERFSGTITATTNNGGSYWVEVTHTNFPVSFVDVPTVVKATEPGTGNAGISGASKATTTNPGKSYLQRSTAYTTSQTIFINIRAEGYWRSPSGAAWAPESLLQSTFARTSASPAAVSVPSGSWTALCTFTGEANTTYLILYGAAFPTNATGYRQLHFAGSSGSAGRYSPSYQAVNGEQTRIEASITYKFVTAGTITLWAKQNSGSSLSVNGWYEAIKLPV